MCNNSQVHLTKSILISNYIPLQKLMQIRSSYLWNKSIKSMKWFCLQTVFSVKMVIPYNYTETKILLIIMISNNSNPQWSQKKPVHYFEKKPKKMAKISIAWRFDNVSLLLPWSCQILHFESGLLGWLKTSGFFSVFPKSSWLCHS